MREADKNGPAAELSAEDLDMAVGGAAKGAVAVHTKEEAEKYVGKGEQRRKMGDAPREEKLKHE